MRGAVLVAAAMLAPALAGCVTGPEPVQPPAEGRFVTVWWTCGFVARGTICTHWQLDADGKLVAFEGYREEDGDGSIHVPEGSLYNVSHRGVRSILHTFDLYDTDANYTVELAYQGHATRAEIASLLLPAGGFYDTQRRYDDSTIVDAGTLNIVVESQRGVHVSSAYTGDGDQDFDRMREAFRAVRDAVEDRLGVPDDS